MLELIDKLLSRPTGLEGGERLTEPILLKKFAYGGASTLVVRRETVLRVNGFDPRFERHQDVEFLLRVLKVGKLVYVGRVLVEKVYSGSPSGDAVVRSTDRLNRKFKDVIDRLDVEGSVQGAQNCMIAKHYLSEGRFVAGLSRLVKAEFPHARDVYGICLALIRGLRERMRQMMTMV